MKLVVNYCHAMVIGPIIQERQCPYTRNNDEARSRNHCCRGKAKSNKYYIFRVCVCNLCFPACKGHEPVTVLSVTCLAIPYFPTLSHHRHDFRGGGGTIEHKMCMLIFLQILSQTFLILRRIHRGFTINICSCSCRVPLLLSDLNET